MVKNNESKKDLLKSKGESTTIPTTKGFTLDTIFKVMDALDFKQDPETVDNLLQRDLEKVYNKYQKKYEGKPLYMKTVEALLRKGYPYDDIQRKLTESGIDHD